MQIKTIVRYHDPSTEMIKLERLEATKQTPVKLKKKKKPDRLKKKSEKIVTQY